MRKTTQTVEVTVEGPNEKGQYCVTSGDEESFWATPPLFVGMYMTAVQQHIDSVPQPVEEFEGFLIGPHTGGGTGVWNLTDRWTAEEGVWGQVSGFDAANAWARVAEFARDEKFRKYVPAAVALAHWFEKKEEA